MTTWVEVRHQAERCKRLHDPGAVKSAARLWFELAREALEATAPAWSRPQAGMGRKNSAGGR